MLEKMADFFNSRLDGYEEHQLSAIEGARQFYPYSASLLPRHGPAKLLDLGCGTGLELAFYFDINPTAQVVGIDLADDMLAVLKKKYEGKAITAIHGSYFEIPFGIECFDAAVSVESLHHFTKEEKMPLYRKVHRALKADGYFILTDYFASSNEEEAGFRQELERLKKEQEITDGELYHFDTPLTVEHEIEALQEAGFSTIDILIRWGATCTMRALK